VIPSNESAESLDNPRSWALLELPESSPVGEATVAPDAETAPPHQAETPSPTPLLLTRALGMEDAPIRVFGWIQNSFTGNTNGTPSNGVNFGVFPNTLANDWMGNQYYAVIENPLEPGDRVNLGFRGDFLFGHDWQFTKMYGLFDRAFRPYQFTGVDLPQFYGELHLPVFTEGGLDIKGGRFANPAEFESFMAIQRPLLSVPYMFNFTPFTLFGVLSTLHVTDRIHLHSGAINGFDRWINRNYIWNYLGGITVSSRDETTKLTLFGIVGPNQLPRFAPADYPLVPVATPPPGFRARQVNPYYARSDRGFISFLLTKDWTDRLTQAFETDHVWDPQTLGFGPGVRSIAYHGLLHWFLFKLTDKATAVWRSEIFWDPNGAATGIGNTYYEMTVGIQWRPQDWLWIRPEARYDWAQFQPAFNDATRKSQLTLGFDVIFLW
jgi:hypothetical protein